MKKVITAGVGGRSFTINEDAYGRLESYLNLFRAHVREVGTQEVMDELESRIAELFYQEVGDSDRVVDMELVEKVISQLGMPDGTDSSAAEEPARAFRKLYRDTDDVRVAGVCSGLALYFGIDTARGPSCRVCRVLAVRHPLDCRAQGTYPRAEVRAQGPRPHRRQSGQIHHP